MERRSGVGRPEATSHGAIEQAAFTLFAEQGFEGTTLDQIAAAVGVTRRTLFRYYASKNDIPWGRFDLTLAGLRDLLAGQPPDLPLGEALGRGIVEFNRFPDGLSPPHATRLRLILRTPALQAHSALRYAEWRAVIAEYAGVRLGRPADDLMPRLAGHLCLAIALSAYEQWLQEGHDDVASLLGLIERGVPALDGFARGA